MKNEKCSFLLLETRKLSGLLSNNGLRSEFVLKRSLAICKHIHKIRGEKMWIMFIKERFESEGAKSHESIRFSDGISE